MCGEVLLPSARHFPHEENSEKSFQENPQVQKKLAFPTASGQTLLNLCETAEWCLQSKLPQLVQRRNLLENAEDPMP